MTGYQFARVEGYSRSGSNQTIHREKKATKRIGDMPKKQPKVATNYKKWSTRDIMAEAMREPDACRHVENPQPPNLVFGIPLPKVIAQADEWGAQAKDLQGRKLRKDGLVMLAGVISLPHDRLEDWPAYRADAIKWVQEKYGDRFKCAIEHMDEAHPHLHFYCVPRHGESFEVLHDGKAAKAEAKAQGDASPDQNAAYRTAMERFQDGFWEKVAMKHGLARTGPGLNRLTRVQWKEKQAEAEALATNVNQIVSGLQLEKQSLIDHSKSLLGTLTREALRVASDYLRDQYVILEERVKELAQRAAAINARETSLDAEKTAVAVRVREIAAKERVIGDLRAHNIALMDANDELLSENLSLKDTGNDQWPHM